MTPETTINNNAKFSEMEFREIIITYLDLSIRRVFKSSHDLKQAIIKSYRLGGLDYLQTQELLKAFNLDNEPNIINYSTKELLDLLESLYNNSYITKEDYFISSGLAAKRNLLSHQERENNLIAHNIDLALINSRDLKQILRDIEKL